MTNRDQINIWLHNNPLLAVKIAECAVAPLLLDAEGEWIEDSDFPSGADYIEHVVSIMDAMGLYKHIDQLQQREKTD
jgi:hypothetical protein